jgi:hypothetical protein
MHSIEPSAHAKHAQPHTQQAIKAYCWLIQEHTRVSLVVHVVHVKRNKWLVFCPCHCSEQLHSTFERSTFSPHTVVA